jgi:hypothetical protein
VLATIASGMVAVLAWQSPSLPDRLTSAEFWRLSTSLSEPPGTFFSDNVVSNELSYAQTVPHFRLLRRGGVYLGVGPEQNFTFISAMEARLAIVVDIRRENLLLHLLYKTTNHMTRAVTTKDTKKSIYHEVVMSCAHPVS